MTTLLKTVKDLNKAYGEGTVVVGSDISQNVIPRITSGSLGLDAILGGGWPCNQAVEIVGAPSNGKTAVALKTIAANQDKDPNFTSVWVAAEEWVPSYAEMCGVDVSRVLVVETNIMEHAFQSVIAFAETKEVDCIVIDSLPALVPSAEDERDMEQMTIGRGALMVNKFFRKIGKSLKRSLVEEERPVLLLVINQWRQLIGVTYGPDKTTPGGQGKDYAYFVRVEVKRDSWIESGKGNAKKKVGQGIRLQTLKNKTARPQQKAFLDFYFADGGDVYRGDYDFAKELVSLSVISGVVEQRGGWFYFADRKWQGAPALLDEIRQDVDLKELIESEVRSMPLDRMM